MSKDDPWKADHGYELKHEKKHNPNCFGTGWEGMEYQIPAARDLLISTLDKISDENGEIPEHGEWGDMYEKLDRMVEELDRMAWDLAQGDECKVCHEKRT